MLTSVGWFGIAVAIVACAVAARTTAEQSFAHALYRVTAASPWLSVPAGLTAAATGTLVGLGSRYGLIKHWWVVVKIVLTVAAVVTDAFLVSALAGAAVGVSNSVTTGSGHPLDRRPACGHRPTRLQDVQ